MACAHCVSKAQEPVLISGLSVAQNLDPTGEAPRSALWKALAECSLDDVIRGFPDGLDTRVGGEDGGVSLTAGLRQLLFFARMLVRRPRIVLLDEVGAGRRKGGGL